MTDSIDPKKINQPNRPTLNNSDTGKLGQALLTLTKELWVLRDRVTVLEAVLEKKGIDVSNEIDSFQPDKAMQEKLDEQAKALMAAVFEALDGR